MTSDNPVEQKLRTSTWVSRASEAAARGGEPNRRTTVAR